MKFATEAMRLSHPEAGRIPISLWNSVFNKEISDAQLNVMKCSHGELLPHLHIAITPFNKTKALTTWLCCSLRSPALEDEELISLAQTLRLSINDQFTTAALGGYLNLIDKLLKQPGVDVPAMSTWCG